MCYAMPGRVVQVAERTAVVDYFGDRRTVRHEFPELRSGDYVFAQGGYVIESLPEPEALEILRVWKETFFELQARDLELSDLRWQRSGAATPAMGLLRRAAQGKELDPGELASLLVLERPEERELLYQVANTLRQKHHGNSCCVHGVLEFSNVCSESCAYCGLSGRNPGLTRRRMTADEIVAVAVDAVKNSGFKALVLQSGEDPDFDAEELGRVLREIKTRVPVLLFISCGEIGFPALERLYKAGARGLLMRFETSRPDLYSRLHPGANLDSRLEHLEAARRLGYLLITGGLIGLPGQTPADLVQDLVLAKRLGADMYSFGPFLPHPATPLHDHPKPDPDLVMSVLAAARLLDPRNANILVSTAFETLDPQARKKGLLAGANSVMLNVTPEPFRGLYDLYPGRAHAGESLPEQIADTLALLRNLGRAPTDLGMKVA